MDDLATVASVAQAGDSSLPLSPAMRDHRVESTNSLHFKPMLALMEQDPSPSPKTSPICKVPIEILLKIFQILAPSGTRESTYTLLKLTQVCQFWRTALINQPQAWATISATKSDRRNFVEMCLERSYPVPLDVTVNVYDHGLIHQSCTCNKDTQSRLVTNEIDPCEWHFTFNSLAKTRHWERIHALDIVFNSSSDKGQVSLAPESCRFFGMPSLRLTTLRWMNMKTSYADNLFLALPFVPTLRSLSFQGSLKHLTVLKNLTSFTFHGDYGHISAEGLRIFILNNQSLEELELDCVWFLASDVNGPPAILSNLQSLGTRYSSSNLSNIFRAPALQRLSSLTIFVMGGYQTTLVSFRATGHGITLTANSELCSVMWFWEDLAAYVKPTFRHVRLENVAGLGFINKGGEGVIKLFMGAHTVDIGNGCAYLYPNFLKDLKELGPELKTIRFGIPKGAETIREPGKEYEMWGGKLWDDIEELVAYRFKHGRPFSAVERMVISESEQVNCQLDFVWRCFYDDRRLDRYVQHE